MVFVVNLVNTAFNILYYLLIARVILSFFALNPYGNSFLAKVKSVIFNITEPILAPLRKVIPLVNMGGGYLDLSPLVALILLSILRSAILSLL